ncbi:MULTISPECIES: antirestriction protein [Hyphomicrobiales]|uniref:antirestriction protein n=1 Tax=Hyphomicrobiales TaxID=356 RepID=UPI000F4582EF|nr:antirestriction protein [Pannonibacter phragmitetus]
MSIDLTTRRSATLVPEDRREKFLPTLFGLRYMIVAESTVYKIMQGLSPYDYRGGFWNFYERGGRPLFLAPTSKPCFQIESGLTDFRGEVSAEAAGIIATLFTLSHLSFSFESDHFAEGYQRLRAYSDGHPESSAIFAAID